MRHLGSFFGFIESDRCAGLEAPGRLDSTASLPGFPRFGG